MDSFVGKGSDEILNNGGRREGALRPETTPATSTQ